MTTDSLNKNMTEMIQQSALSIAKQTKKQKNPKITYKSSDEEAREQDPQRPHRICGDIRP